MCQVPDVPSSCALNALNAHMVGFAWFGLVCFDPSVATPSLLLYFCAGKEYSTSECSTCTEPYANWPINILL